MQNAITVIELTENTLKYSDVEKKFELNWELFSLLEIHKKYLVLYIDTVLFTLLIFDRDHHNEQEIQKITEFLINKVGKYTHC
jgi:hypothetical protein